MPIKQAEISNYNVFCRYTKTFFIALCLFAGLVIWSAQAANAASLHVSPSAASRGVSEPFTVSILVSSPDQDINAVHGNLLFSQDVLEVVAINKNSSIINLWVQEPSFSNTGGEISFEGIILNPGYKGQSGKIADITFRGKAPGSAHVRFSSGAVLANDGQGTNILASMGNAMFTLDASAQPASAAAHSALMPNISSSTHPDPDAWYAVSSPQISWSLPPGVTAVRTLIAQQSGLTPTVLYEPPIRSRSLSALEDGVWHFSVQFREGGTWGRVASFRLQIDTTEPERFDITPVNEGAFTGSKARFQFSAHDETSGIEYYNVQIGDGDFKRWEDDGSGIYKTPDLPPGSYALTAQAVDRAGNSRSESVEFVIEGDAMPAMAAQTAWKTIAYMLLSALALLTSLFIAWLAWHRFFRVRKKIMKKVHKVDQALHRAFAFIHEKEIKKQIDMLKKAGKSRSLTKEEKRIMKWFNEYLDDSA